MILGDNTVRSSNHQARLEQGLIESGVLMDDENLKPDAVSGEEDEEEQEAVTRISEFAVIFAIREEMSLSRRPDESAQEKIGSQAFRAVKISFQVQ